MTREEAKQMIESMGKYLSDGNPIWEKEPVKEATRMAIEALRADKISRTELFNKLATVNAPMEANEYKAEVYRIINEM